MIPLLLTILFPGLGHFYYGKNKKALILAGISLIPFVYPFSLIYALYDIVKLNKSGIAPELSKREAIAVIVIALVVPIVFGITMVITLPKVLQSVEERSNPRVNNETMNEIALKLEKMYDREKKYPADLAEIIADNPMRKKWEFDPWGNRYVYETNEERSSFELISTGKDREINTSDDIVVRNVSKE